MEKEKCGKGSGKWKGPNGIIGDKRLSPDVSILLAGSNGQKTGVCERLFGIKLGTVIQEEYGLDRVPCHIAKNVGGGSLKVMGRRNGVSVEIEIRVSEAELTESQKRELGLI